MHADLHADGACALSAHHAQPLVRAMRTQAHAPVGRAHYMRAHKESVTNGHIGGVR